MDITKKKRTQRKIVMLLVAIVLLLIAMGLSVKDGNVLRVPLRFVRNARSLPQNTALNMNVKKRI
jgi:hypothetical protein